MRFHRRHPLVASCGLMLAACLVAGGLAVVSSAGVSAATTLGAAATFSGPVTVGHVIEPISVQPSGIAAHGYVEQEFFAAGTATAFHSRSTPSDGKWTLTAATTAPYRTRILVRRPSNAARFNGTVVVEWMNVTAGESAPDWDYTNPALMEAGDAWVGVSVQAVAVEGGTPLLGSPAGGGNQGLVQQEPARYGTLHHPGDRYALDLFEQVGLGLHAPHGAHVFGPLHPRHFVAAGESQSAFYLTTYADALQPISHAYDGIFIHSRDGSGAPLNSASVLSGSLAGGLRIRTDLGVPVFMFETQTDVTLLGYASAQQPDTKDIRTWEVAGTSHADSYLVGSYVGALGCQAAINMGPQHEVVEAALQDFVNWVAHGTPPPSPSPFSVERKPSTLARDSHGNVIGGVRTPAVDVPVSTLSEVAPMGSSVICTLFGSTAAFSPATLASLYGTKANYIAEYTADLDRAIAARYLLPSERASLLATAQQVHFPAG
jgi:hypothetical protein